LEAAKVGVLVPTFNRPDLLRACVLQLAAQSRPPDVVCIFQNGNPHSYQWAVEDILSRGYALATIYREDVAADHDPYFASGIHPLFPDLQKRDDNFGTIGAWVAVWGASTTREEAP